MWQIFLLVVDFVHEDFVLNPPPPSEMGEKLTNSAENPQLIVQYRTLNVVSHYISKPIQGSSQDPPKRLHIWKVTCWGSVKDNCHSVLFTFFETRGNLQASTAVMTWRFLLLSIVGNNLQEWSKRVWHSSVHLLCFPPLRQFSYMNR